MHLASSAFSREILRRPLVVGETYDVWLCDRAYDRVLQPKTRVHRRLYVRREDPWNRRWAAEVSREDGQAWYGEPTDLFTTNFVLADGSLQRDNTVSRRLVDKWRSAYHTQTSSSCGGSAP